MDVTQIRFRAGDFQSFIATKTFALGNTGVSLSEGMDVLFDGSSVEVGGMRYPFPQLKAALKLGWIVPEAEYDPDAMPAAAPMANIQVRPAVAQPGTNPMQPPSKSTITTTESDERVVMNRKDRTATAQQINKTARQAGGGQARSFGRGGEVEVGGAEFGIPLQRPLRTPAKAVTEVTHTSVGQAIREADTVKVQPGEGISEEEYLARLTPEQREERLAAKEAKRAEIVTRLNPNYKGPPVTQIGQPVAQVRTASSGASVRQGSTPVFDASGTQGPVSRGVIEAEGIRFSTTNGPSPEGQGGKMISLVPDQASQLPEGEPVSRIEKDGTGDARRLIAKAICKDFPDAYSFSDHWKRRIAMIRLNYEDRPDVIRAVFAAESDDFKKLLLDEFPEVFASLSLPEATRPQPQPQRTFP